MVSHVRPSVFRLELKIRGGRAARVEYIQSRAALSNRAAGAPTPGRLAMHPYPPAPEPVPSVPRRHSRRVPFRYGGLRGAIPIRPCWVAGARKDIAPTRTLFERLACALCIIKASPLNQGEEQHAYVQLTVHGHLYFRDPGRCFRHRSGRTAGRSALRSWITALLSGGHPPFERGDLGGHESRRAAHRQGRRLVLSISGDAGWTWSKPWTAVDGPEDDRNPALGQTADGTVLLAYAVLSGYDASGLKLSPKREERVFDGVYIMRSKDKGKSWTQPERSEGIYSFYAGKGPSRRTARSSSWPTAPLSCPSTLSFLRTRQRKLYLPSKDGGKTGGIPRSSEALQRDGCRRPGRRQAAGRHALREGRTPGRDLFRRTVATPGANRSR